jgi:hypothetical protein
MKVACLRIGVALLALMVGKHTCAQPDAGSSPVQSELVLPDDPGYAPLAVLPSELQTPSEAGAGEAMISPPPTSVVRPYEFTEPSPPAPPGPQPWKLPQPRVFQRLGIDMGGWVQQGITFNGDDPADGFNGPICTNDLADQYQLNQAWLYFVRPTKTDGCGWDVGGRFDMVWGTDWRFGQNFGLEDRINGNDNFYGLIFPQAYLEVAINDLTVKMGHFATFTTYEVVPAPLNFFYSHTYAMSGYFDPCLVTGLMTEYKLNENWTLLNGFHRGPFMFEDVNDDLNYLGGAKWASDSKQTTLSMMVDSGAQDPLGENNRTSYFLVFTHQLNERILYAVQHTLGFEDDGSVQSPGQDAQWYGLAQWLFYKLNPKWSVGARFEWMRDDDGARIFGIGNILGSNKGWLGAPGFAGDFYNMSLGLNWRPNPNMIFRPEVRWDWYEGTRNIAGELPFDAGTDASQFTTAMDLVVTF